MSIQWEVKHSHLMKFVLKFWSELQCYLSRFSLEEYTGRKFWTGEEIAKSSQTLQYNTIHYNKIVLIWSNSWQSTKCSVSKMWLDCNSPLFFMIVNKHIEHPCSLWQSLEHPTINCFSCWRLAVYSNSFVFYLYLLFNPCLDFTSIPPR